MLMEWADHLEAQLRATKSILPETINPDALDSLLASIYAEVWEY